MANTKLLKITWHGLNFKNEVYNYTENKYTRDYFNAKYKLVFVSDNDLIKFLSCGSYVVMSKRNILYISHHNMKTTDDFKEEMKDDKYRKEYEALDHNLTVTGKLVLPSPIIIKFPTLYYGFSGDMRTNLAYNHGIPIKFWVVDYKRYLRELAQATKIAKKK